MRAALIALLVGLTTMAQANPYMTMSAPELRRAIADSPKVLEENWYQVEILAFARRTQSGSEYWRLDQQPDLNRQALIRLDREEPQLPDHADNVDISAVAMGAWQVLDSNTLSLRDMAGKLDKAGDRILLHRAWRQPIRERARAFSVLIEGGNPLPVIEPVIDPSPVDADLAVDARGAFTALPALEPIELSQESYTQRELQGALRFHLGRFLHIEPQLWYNSSDAGMQRFWVNIDQSRRMRSEELHYLDHPLFGLMVIITPWKHPEQKKLEDLKAALRAKESR
jgi:hypothetical protein